MIKFKSVKSSTSANLLQDVLIASMCFEKADIGLHQESYEWCLKGKVFCWEVVGEISSC